MTLAAIDPPLRYTPFADGWRDRREQEPATYWWQGLTRGRLEGMLDVLTVPSGDSDQGRVVSFGEFERLYGEMFDDPDETRRKSVAAASNALHRLRPADRPVFWRMMIAQARLWSPTATWTATSANRGSGSMKPSRARCWRRATRRERRPARRRR